MNKEIKVALAEDHLILRQSMISLLKRRKNLQVVCDASNGKELLDALKECDPDIVVLDIDMPVMDGKTTLRLLTKEYPHIKVIMLSQHFNEDYVVGFIGMGARSYLPKENAHKELVDAIVAVHSKGYSYSNAVAEILAASFAKRIETPVIKLTRREQDIERLLRLNLTNAQIAERLGISKRTAERHRQNLTRKTRD